MEWNGIVGNRRESSEHIVKLMMGFNTLLHGYNSNAAMKMNRKACIGDAVTMALYQILVGARIHTLTYVSTI